ncbi:ABC transporter permease [Hyphomicrobium sp.]|uniref:ABC transporter permease n=1 Tax=Hyphomicrobium sp. TaxID=82 RepID=UPI002D7761B0|nr:FtsX-like permease family protein [Hyphomicrobium sp.]HET6389790.1 FtsX-like permease family protein [Hyphomicrobium sp.]
MKRWLWPFLTLISHWRRHPANLATLLVGLAVATALWSGVQALNQQALRSYERATTALGIGDTKNLLPTRDSLFPQDLYVKLRLAGWKVSPVLEGNIRIGGQTFQLIGIEPLTLPHQSRLVGVKDAGSIERFLKPPSQTLVSNETRRRLGLAEGDRPATESGQRLPPLTPSAETPPGPLVVDIGVAQRVLNQPQRLSRLIVAADPAAGAPSLSEITGGQLRLVEPQSEGDLARLTDSFHLNLTAFALLAFLVGLFIAHASFGLAFEQRLPMIRTMRAVGVSARTVVSVMLVELVALALVAGAAGMIGGYLIAATLLPDMAASLGGLYGARVPGQLTLEAKWWLSGLGMALLGTFAATVAGLYKTYRLPVLSIAHACAVREAQERYLRRQALMACIGLLIAVIAFFFGDSLLAGFVMMAGVLIGSALLLPLALASFLRAAERRAHGALAGWFWADSRQQLSSLSLALMALLIALATNVGVGTMVDGFRKTFTAWLDQRLVAEVYFEAANTADARRIQAWLEKRPEVSAILPAWRTETRLAGLPVEVFGFKDHATYREHFPLLSATGAVWDDVRRGEGVLVSEQLARRMKLPLGSTLQIPASSGSWSPKVAGIYPDYGNPKGQVRVNVDALTSRWPEVPQTAYSLRAEPQAVPSLLAAMRAEFGNAIVRSLDQATLKSLSTEIFEKTFAVTAALNTLTLMVSGIALLASLLTLGNIRLAQLAPIWAIGVTRRRLSELELMRILFLAAATALMAIPLGLVLAWCLVAVVNVQAFGWRLPLHVFPGQWLLIFLLALVTAFVASIIPIIRLGRTPPADLLRIFASER